MENKVLIIGAGLVGSVVARCLAEEKGWTVEVWERRDHTGGNIYDHMDEYGIRIHQYGPHIFHTDIREVYDFILKYGEWQDYRLICGAVIDEICIPTAFNYKAIDSFFSKEKANEIKAHIRETFPSRTSATVVELLTCKDELIKEFAQFLFDKDYSLYTAKQWGVSPLEIDPSVLKRVPIRFSYEENYFTNQWQLMPKHGYARFIENLLNHPNIDIKLGKDALKFLEIKGNRVIIEGKPIDFPVIYTGPLDELFAYSDGKLPYRSLRFEWRHEDIDSFQELPVVAYPQADGYTRIVEYKKLPVQDVRGTTYALEYPLAYSSDHPDMEPYYPVLTSSSQCLYEKYREKAKQVTGLYFCGRLADFKYYDMDKAIARALEFCRDMDLKTNWRA